MTISQGNRNRFSGFADLYDANRPVAPEALGALLCAYANVAKPIVVDLGSGTGLSTRWAATWAGSVVGIEPNDDMRATAERRGGEGVSYRECSSNATGLDAHSADIVLAVQAMHWMEPTSTLAEVDRILRPGGVFATADADWPPVAGVASAEDAWASVHRRMRVVEARLTRGESGADLRRPIADDDPALVDEDLRDPHRNRAIPDVQSWSKAEHLSNIIASGCFSFAREVVFDQPAGGSAERFVALMRSQGSYQSLLRAGLTDTDLGVDVFERAVHDAFAAAPNPPPLSFSWRVRLGVKPA
jgi:SAM-dependent methyltransferase